MNHDTQPYQARGTDRGLVQATRLCAHPAPQLRLSLRMVWRPVRHQRGAPFPPSCGGALPSLSLARKLYAYGEQVDYFDYETCIGWVRYGTWDRPFGCAVVVSNAGPGTKRMHVGEMHAGETWTDVLGWESSKIVIGQDGYADFICPGTSVSVWVNEKADGREKFQEVL